MAFHENWFAGPKQRRLKEELARVTATTGSVVEVGCWEGRSTIIIANHFAPEPVHCIDHWLGDLTHPEGIDPGPQLSGERDVLADFNENMIEATAGNYITHVMDWREFDWSQVGPIRFIFIDAQHTYEEVLDNLKAIYDQVVPGGVIAGDDYTVRGVDRAVNEFFGVTMDDVTKFGPGRAIWGVVR